MISENGWTVYDNPSHFVRFTAAGRGWWAANADCAVVAAEFITRWDAEVESVTKDDPELDDWSYAFRAVRGQTSGYSNHASATAWDVNATQHPRGVALAKTFTSAQIATVHRIRSAITDYSGRPVFRWGGDYVNSLIDGMHIEINATAAEVKQAANKIRNRQKAETDMPLTNADVDLIWGHPNSIIGQSPGGAVKTTMDRVDADNLQAQVREGIEVALSDSAHPLTARLVAIESALDQILAKVSEPPAQ
jgi:hypothetical protein